MTPAGRPPSMVIPRVPVLPLEAAARLGGKITKLAMYDAPYNDDADARRAWKEYIRQLTELLMADRRGDSVALFRKYLGTPDGQIEGMRRAPFWPTLEAIAPTLAYDHAGILGQNCSVPAERAAAVRAPALVIHGAASVPFMHTTARTLSETIPHAQLRSLSGQSHDVSPEVLAPVLVEFFAQ